MFKRFRVRTFALAGVAALAVPAMGFLTTTSAQAAEGSGYGDFKVKVIANSLNSRSWPTTAAAKVWTYKKGAVVDIMCKVNTVSVDGNRRWYMVGAGSWISARYATNVGTVPTWCPEYRPDVAKAVKKPSVNLRQGPTNASKIVGKLTYGTKVEIICKVNGPVVGGNPRWYQLRDGRWVTARYMRNIGEAPRFCSAKAP